MKIYDENGNDVLTDAFGRLICCNYCKTAVIYNGEKADCRCGFMHQFFSSLDRSKSSAQ